MFLSLFPFLFKKNRTDCDAPIRRQRGQIIRLVTVRNMTVQRHHHPRSISVQQLRSPFHHTSNPTILVRAADVVVFDRQDHSTNSTEKKKQKQKQINRKNIILNSYRNNQTECFLVPFAFFFSNFLFS